MRIERHPGPKPLIVLMMIMVLQTAVAGISTAQVFHVDPVGGKDTVSGGGVSNPFKTLTYAVSRYAGLPATLDLRLKPGQYDPTTGESFPLALPPRTTLKAVIPGTVIIRKSAMQLTSVFSAANADTLRFEDVFIGSPDRGLQCTSTNASTLNLTLIGCGMGNSRDIALNLTNTHALVTLLRCDLGGGDTGVRLNVHAGSTLNLSMDSCIIKKVWHGIYASADGQGANIFSVIRGCHFNAPGVNGIYSLTQNGGQVVDWIEGCVFYNCGGFTIPNKGNGLKDQWDSVSSPPIHAVANNAFYLNGTDMPDYNPATYLLQNNLVQDPGLAGKGGSITGNPLFVKEAKGNFRLQLASPCRDRGSNQAVTLPADFDGCPRIDPRPLGGAGRVDIGAHEYYPYHLSAHPEPASIGQKVDFRYVGPPGSSAFVGLGTGILPVVPFGGGFRLLNMAQLPVVSVGVLAADHSLTMPVMVPNAPAIIGLAVFWQSAYLLGSNITFSYNVFRMTFK